MSVIGYQKTQTVKIVRTKHVIGFRSGATTAGYLSALLAKMPPDAVVDEVLCDYDNDPTLTTIQFHEESRSE
jgi:hypothetical protein